MADKEKDLSEERENSRPAPSGAQAEEAGPGEAGAGEEGAATFAEQGASPEGGESEELAELRRRYMYLAAEFDNYRKRVAREKEGLVAFGNERLLRAILPVLDNLERAMAHEGETASAEAILSGVRMTYEQMLAELRKFGLEQVQAAGRVFDPNLHEAIARVPWEGEPEGTVLTEERKGYLLNGRLLRPAQVTVAIRPQAAAGGSGGDGSDAGGREG